jgi:hypothetical protein
MGRRDGSSAYFWASVAHTEKLKRGRKAIRAAVPGLTEWPVEVGNAEPPGRRVEHKPLEVEVGPVAELAIGEDAEECCAPFIAKK